jgi:hypothetical protein
MDLLWAVPVPRHLLRLAEVHLLAGVTCGAVHAQAAVPLGAGNEQGQDMEEKKCF